MLLFFLEGGGGGGSGKLSAKVEIQEHRAWLQVDFLSSFAGTNLHWIHTVLLI